MSRFSSRVGRRPGLLGGLLFLAALALAGALAWQAVQAAASHRAAAEASLSHHAAIAAWRFAREGRSWIGWGMDQAGNTLQQQTASLATLPGPELVEQLLAEKECDCMTAGFARTVFRVRTGGPPSLDLLGEPLSERAKDLLVAAAARLAADTGSGRQDRVWQILPPGEPRLTRATDVALLWKVGDRARGTRGVYGMIVEPEQIARPLRGARGEAQFFPPSLVPPTASDSLVHLEVAGPNRQPLFDAGPATHAFFGTDTLGRHFGGLTVTAAIAPAAARLLLAGELPASRSPTILGLLALTLGLGGAALLLLRREHRLARLREDFVSGVSHELRTPLTQIRVLSELLESGGFHSDAEKQRATGVIHREALRLTNLVENVLEFSRLRRPAAAERPTAVSLGEVVRELADAFAPLTAPRGDRVEVVIAEEVEIIADRDLVVRVLRNLVENAAKYGPPGQVIRITVSPADVQRTVRVSIDDQGPGIPADERSRIWQPYYRLDRDRNAPAGGSGLGLSVVAESMRLLGGRAWVDDAPGEAGGARFTVEFAGARAADMAAR